MTSEDNAATDQSNGTGHARFGREGPLKAVLFGVWLTSLGAFLTALGGRTVVGFGAVAAMFGSGIVAVGLAKW